MAVDFSNYLSVPVDTIERPRALPAGHWYATVAKWSTGERNFAKAGDPPKIVPLCTVAFSISGPDEDVEDTDFDATKITASMDYDLSDERGMFALRRLVSDTCGVDTKGLDLSDALNAIKGSDVKVFSEPRADPKEEGTFYTKISKVLPA